MTTKCTKRRMIQVLFVSYFHMTQRWLQDFSETMDRNFVQSGSLDPRPSNNTGISTSGFGFSHNMQVRSPSYF